MALMDGEGRWRCVAVDLAGWRGGVLVDGVAVGVAVLALRWRKVVVASDGSGLRGRGGVALDCAVRDTVLCSPKLVED